MLHPGSGHQPDTAAGNGTSGSPSPPLESGDPDNATPQELSPAPPVEAGDSLAAGSGAGAAPFLGRLTQSEMRAKLRRQGLRSSACNSSVSGGRESCGEGGRGCQNAAGDLIIADGGGKSLEPCAARSAQQLSDLTSVARAAPGGQRSLRSSQLLMSASATPSDSRAAATTGRRSKAPMVSLATSARPAEGSWQSSKADTQKPKSVASLKRKMFPDGEPSRKRPRPPSKRIVRNGATVRSPAAGRHTRSMDTRGPNDLSPLLSGAWEAVPKPSPSDPKGSDAGEVCDRLSGETSGQKRKIQPSSPTAQKPPLRKGGIRRTGHGLAMGTSQPLSSGDPSAAGEPSHKRPRPPVKRIVRKGATVRSPAAGRHTRSMDTRGPNDLSPLLSGAWEAVPKPSPSDPKGSDAGEVCDRLSGETSSQKRKIQPSSPTAQKPPLRKGGIRRTGHGLAMGTSQPLSSGDPSAAPGRGYDGPAKSATGMYTSKEVEQLFAAAGTDPGSNSASSSEGSQSEEAASREEQQEDQREPVFTDPIAVRLRTKKQSDVDAGTEASASRPSSISTSARKPEASKRSVSTSSTHRGCRTKASRGDSGLSCLPKRAVALPQGALSSFWLHLFTPLLLDLRPPFDSMYSTSPHEQSRQAYCKCLPNHAREPRGGGEAIDAPSKAHKLEKVVCPGVSTSSLPVVKHDSCPR